MPVLRILGRRAPGPVVAWQVVVAALSCSLLLAYPVALALLGGRHASSALGVLGASLLLAACRALAAARVMHRIRGIVYDVLGAAIRSFPVVREAPTGTEQVEADIVRGAPWAEVRYATTLPSLAGVAMALPLLAFLVARELGVGATALGGGALMVGMAVALGSARLTSRAVTKAWQDYDRITRLVDRSLRGRAELRAHGLDGPMAARLRSEVTHWSRHEQRSHLLGALTSWAAPGAALAFAAVGALLLGRDPLAAASRSLEQPDRTTIMGPLLTMAALPALFALSRGIREYVFEQPHLAALTSFVASASERPAPGSPSPPAAIRVAAAYRYPARENAASVELRADFHWAERESLGVVGPNGCGKTTLALLLIGLVRPSDGSIDLGNGAGTLAGQVAYLPQGAFFGDTESVADEVRFVAPDAPQAAVFELLSELLPGFDPADLAKRTASSLSAGERRLVALARVLLRDSPVLVLDEPEANLDAGARRRALEVLRRVASARRLLILTHDDDFAALASRTLRFQGHMLSERAAPGTTQE